MVPVFVVQLVPMPVGIALEKSVWEEATTAIGAKLTALGKLQVSLQYLPRIVAKTNAVHNYILLLLLLLLPREPIPTYYHNHVREVQLHREFRYYHQIFGIKIELLANTVPCTSKQLTKLTTQLGVYFLDKMP
mmetsp:Transcript_23841/g.49899  ORF Transcript_23841/g.49899 Transcript_23841/m.49899 type:complete len:133 (-) Transcript_23841:831-1229(-)